MTSDEWEDLTCEVAIALEVFDWTRTSELCANIAAAIRQNPDGALAPVERMLKRLRRKRQFKPIALVADALFETRSASIVSGLLYAQALTDSNYLFAAEQLLEWLSQRTDAASLDALSELHGMRGRIAKQRHVNSPAAGSDRAREYLRQAVGHYLTGYRLNPEDNFWHGVNAVALIERARRRHLALEGVPSADELIRGIRSTLHGRQSTGGHANVWELATELEVDIALGDAEHAAAVAATYAANETADAFEIESTRRQLEEVWELNDRIPPGSTVLPILRAALLRRDGGSLRLTSRNVARDLEKLFTGSFKTVQWYQEGLRCCASIARIETPLGRALGTGWLFHSGALFSGLPDEMLMITNAHVINGKGEGGALTPDGAVARFEMLGEVTGFAGIVWSSPVNECDATILRLVNTPAKAAGLSLTHGPLPMDGDGGERRRRLYIIGYPGGRGLEFSFDDNILIAADQRRVHYRTPTEGGSSGSPVFDEDGWQVVALHHAGKAKMRKLDDPASFHEANEGILISAIRAALPRSC